MENWFEVFKGWVKELVPLGQVEEHSMSGVVREEGDCGEVERAWFCFYTDSAVYRVTATAERMVCGATARAWLAGEDWHRGHDCGDGDFSRATWDGIVQRMLRAELVRVRKRRASTSTGATEADETPATT